MKSKFDLLKLLCFYRRDSSSEHSNIEKGFTLTELLIVVIIGGLIVSTLMSLVIQLVSTEQRESARTETQREMQLALDYIASDLRQAVYVYDGSPTRIVNGEAKDSYLKYLPQKLQDVGVQPALAFWKPVPFDPVAEKIPGYLDDGCNGLSDKAQVKECNNLWLQRRTYSLVVYLQVPRDDDDEKWKGKSRLVRYELKKYEDPTTFKRTPGYADPSESGVSGFVSWPFNGDGKDLQGGVPPKDEMVTLVDFVDDNDGPLPNGQTTPTRCPGYNDSAPEESTYLMQPRDAGDFPAFYTCIGNANSTTSEEDSGGANQDIQLYLRGNISGRGSSGDKPMSPLQTRLTMRGVIDKRVER